jgi:hypothetical protein
MSTLLTQDTIVTVVAIVALAMIGYRIYKATRPAASCGSCGSCGPVTKPGATATGTPPASTTATVISIDSLRTSSTRH